MRPNKNLKVRMRQMENKTMKIRIPAVLVVIALTITTASAQYQRTDLVSNGPTVVPFTDPHLVNAWGLVALPTSPWWTSDNGTGDSSLAQRGGSASYRRWRNHEFRDRPACAIQPRGDPRHTDRYRRKHQPHRERLYRHGRGQIGPIVFYLRHTRRYDQRLESHSRLS